MVALHRRGVGRQAIRPDRIEPGAVRLGRHRHAEIPRARRPCGRRHLFHGAFQHGDRRPTFRSPRTSSPNSERPMAGTRTPMPRKPMMPSPWPSWRSKRPVSPIAPRRSRCAGEGQLRKAAAALSSSTRSGRSAARHPCREDRGRQARRTHATCQFRTRVRSCASAFIGFSGGLSLPSDGKPGDESEAI